MVLMCQRGVMLQPWKDGQVLEESGKLSWGGWSRKTLGKKWYPRWGLKVIRSAVNCQGAQGLSYITVRRLKIAWAFGK